MEDWWVGGLMRWGTNEMGDQWDGGPLGLADDGVTNEKGDQWDGGPMRWGTNEMGDQWAPIMYWGTNELGDQWEGDQWEGGPMRGGTSERIPWSVAQINSQNIRKIYQSIVYTGCRLLSFKSQYGCQVIQFFVLMWSDQSKINVNVMNCVSYVSASLFWLIKKHISQFRITGRSDAVVRISANDSAAFKESCAPIG